MDSFTLLILGITGNLAQIKLIPALYDLAKNRLLPKDFTIIGVGRKDLSQTEFADHLHQVLHLNNPHHQHPINEVIFRSLRHHAHYLKGDFNSDQLYHELANQIKGNTIIYLATYPSLYATIFAHLHQAGLTHPKKSWTRIVIEKPIGTDLPSAQKLNSLLLRYFVEDQIYRLDHYLGKETLQNIITFRFGNGLFEPLMNHQFIDHFQVTAAEDFGIGKRGGYYDSVGALRDVGQNHLLQMIALTTMDDPVHFTNQAITQKRIEVLQKLTPLPDQIVYGQYQGYLQEDHVAPQSPTDTFFAFKTYLDNDRFKNVPIYVRAGKKLARTVTEIAVVFKLPVNRLFRELDCGLEPNMLVFRIQPNEGIVLRILTKTPGHAQQIAPTYMQFCYRQLAAELTDPYERLIADVLRGDQTFFNDAPEVEAQWAFIDPLMASRKKPLVYKPGTWGPKQADQLLIADNRHWFEPSTVVCQL